MLRKGEFSVGVCEHVFDYMNKIEDMFHAEGQTDRFAKKGRSCFGHSFTTLAPDGYNFDGAVGAGSLLCVNIRQFCNDSKQDFEHSLTLLDAAIELFVEACPFAHTLNGSKDGAVNFGFGFNLAYPRVLEKHGLMAGIIDTPETGSGKDEEDQDFRQVQCALRLWVNGGGDVLSAEDATDAADQLQGPEKGKLNVLTTIKRGVGPLPLVKEKFIAGRLYRYHHHFNDEVKYTGTTMHRYAGVGSVGKHYAADEISNFWPSLHKVSELSYTQCRSNVKLGSKLVLSRKRVASERASHISMLGEKRKARVDKKERLRAAKAQLRFEDQCNDGGYHCDLWGCNYKCLTSNNIRLHMAQCSGRNTKADKEIEALDSLPPKVRAAWLDVSSAVTAEERADVIPHQCPLFSGEEHRLHCTSSVHWQLPISWAAHKQNPSVSGSHSVEAATFLEEKFAAGAGTGSDRTEPGEAAKQMRAYFHGGVGRSFEHKKTRSQIKAWFSKRAQKGKEEADVD